MTLGTTPGEILYTGFVKVLAYCSNLVVDVAERWIFSQMKEQAVDAEICPPSRARKVAPRLALVVDVGYRMFGDRRQKPDPPFFVVRCLQHVTSTTTVQVLHDLQTRFEVHDVGIDIIKVVVK